MRGVTLPARGWIACQKSVTDAGSIMVPVVRVVVPISGRPNGLKAGHGKPKRFPTEKTSRLRSFTCERTDMPGGAHQRCCAVTLATPGSLLPVLTPLLLQGRVQPAGQLVYKGSRMGTKAYFWGIRQPWATWYVTLPAFKQGRIPDRIDEAESRPSEK